jgi:hypothetical protein
MNRDGNVGAQTAKLRYWLAAASLILVACRLCGNDIGHEEASPGGKFKSVVFERDCGATTGTPGAFHS